MTKFILNYVLFSAYRAVNTFAVNRNRGI